MRSDISRARYHPLKLNVSVTINARTLFELDKYLIKCRLAAGLYLADDLGRLHILLGRRGNDLGEIGEARPFALPGERPHRGIVLSSVCVPQLCANGDLFATESST